MVSPDGRLKRRQREQRLELWQQGNPAYGAGRSAVQSDVVSGQEATQDDQDFHRRKSAADAYSRPESEGDPAPRCHNPSGLDESVRIEAMRFLPVGGVSMHKPGSNDDGGAARYAKVSACHGAGLAESW